MSLRSKYFSGWFGQGHNNQGTLCPRGTTSKNFRSGDTSVGDELTLHPGLALGKRVPMADIFRDKTFGDMLRAWVDDGYDGADQDPVEGRHTVAHQAPGVQTQQDFCTNRHRLHRI